MSYVQSLFGKRGDVGFNTYIAALEFISVHTSTPCVDAWREISQWDVNEFSESCAHFSVVGRDKSLLDMVDYVLDCIRPELALH